MRTTTLLVSLIAITMCSAVLARTPFDGTWSVDNSKSQLAGGTMTFQNAGNGTLKYTDSEQSYIFKPDGSAFTTPMGEQQTFQKTSDSIYAVTTKRNGLLLTTETWRLSADGNTLTIESRGTRPDGNRFDNHETDIRTSAGTGIVGSWKSTMVKVTAPQTLAIQTAGKDDVILTISAIKATVQGKWGGKEYPVRGPTQPSGATAALTRVGTRGFKMVYEVNGKVLQIMHFAVAADGRSMVVEGTNGNGKEAARQVWDKQF